MKPGLAVFDFDGTITTSDSLMLFIRRFTTPGRLALGAALLAPTLAGQAVGLIDNGKAKERVLGRFFAGWSRERLRSAGADLAQNVLPGVLRPAAMARIAWHQAQGHRVLVVSASPEEWVRPWAQGHGLECLATRLLYQGEIFTGRFDGLNCHGPEKLRRLREHLPDLAAHHGFAYGDSRGDRELLAWADEKFYRRFK